MYQDEVSKQSGKVKPGSSITGKDNFVIGYMPR
jgi:hypothetical protein